MNRANLGKTIWPFSMSELAKLLPAKNFAHFFQAPSFWLWSTV